MGRDCALTVVKKLPSRDFAVLTINNKEPEKLCNNIQWVETLGSNIKVITKTYKIMINGVNVADFDMTNKKRAIKHIIDSNTDIKGLQGMDIK